MADRLYTSQNADDIISTLRLATGLDKSVIARIAFVYSLVLNGTKVAHSKNFGGGEMKKTSFVGNDELFIKTLIKQVYSKSELDEDEFYSNNSIVKDHIDTGANLLWHLYKKNGEDVNKWYKEIISFIEIDNKQTLKAKDLDIFIGKTVLGNERLVLELNNTQKHANSHIAIMGKPGVGKTQFLLKILADIRRQSDFQTHFIFFDYKGDVVGEEKFIEVTKARIYRLLQNNEYLPINPFVLPEYSDQAIQLSAREKAESFASINSKMGVVQKGYLTEAITSAYLARKNSDKPYPDFNEVLDIALQIYENEGKSDDTLIEVLRDLSKFNLFWSHGCDIPPFERITNKTMVIDVSKMPVLKELVAYLVIERLYKEMISLPDSSIKNNRRTVRTILVIDEAHNYLTQKNIFLQRIIREGRSKGIVVFFASQSPSDYQQKFFNFQELLEFVFVFQSEGVNSKSVQELLGCNIKTAKDLQVEIARLEPFQVITRSNKATEEYTKFIAEAFYKNY